MDIVINEKCLDSILKTIHQLTGITVSKNRSSMVESRLRKRLLALKLESYEDYMKLVCSDEKEQLTFIDLITTNETSFFRTPRIWKYIETKFLPNWFSLHPKQTFSAWSAATSSGEEAYSLSMICQIFKENQASFGYQIMATDISQKMIALCERGKYSGRSIAAFQETKPEWFNKHMCADVENNFQPSQAVRSKIKFQTHNLFKPLKSKDKFDLIMIRNVLIYFSREDQEQVLLLLSSKLKQDGLLIIGESESLSHIKTPFKQIEPLIYHLNSDSTSSKDLS